MKYITLKYVEKDNFVKKKLESVPRLVVIFSENWPNYVNFEHFFLRNNKEVWEKIMDFK